jgi:hypothetical protein
MKIIMKIFLVVAAAYFSVSAQQTTFQDSLLDHIIGKWVLHGTIAEKETTHDIVAQWVLGHQYLQLHEVSREKNTTGEAMYEAIVYIGWDQNTKQYACLWLDITGGGGLSAQAIGHAELSGDKMAFLRAPMVVYFIQLSFTTKVLIFGYGSWIVKRMENCNPSLGLNSLGNSYEII